MKNPEKMFKNLEMTQRTLEKAKTTKKYFENLETTLNILEKT